MEVKIKEGETQVVKVESKIKTELEVEKESMIEIVLTMVDDPNLEEIPPNKEKLEPMIEEDPDSTM